MCFIPSIFFYFHWNFVKKRYFYEKEICIDFFKSSPSARLYLEVLVTISRLNLKQCALAFSYVIYPFVSSIALFSSRKKWLHYLSHTSGPHLQGKLINWTSAFYLSFCCTVLLRILNILIFMDTVISINCNCSMLFHM